jgi:hypothetical protein
LIKFLLLQYPYSIAPHWFAANRFTLAKQLWRATDIFTVLTPIGSLKAPVPFVLLPISVTPIPFSAYSFTLKMEEASSSELSTNLHQTLWHRIPEYRYVRSTLDSSVGIATGWTAGVRFQAKARIFSSRYRPDRFWSPPSLISNAYRGLVPRL